MVDFTPIAEGLALAAQGQRDQSGKTPLDDAFERLDLHSGANRSEFAVFLADQLPSLIGKGPIYLKLWRQLVRRSRIRDRELATSVERSLSQAQVRTDVNRRLWLSLALMDLGRPRSVASLRHDAELKKTYVGEWLTLIAANDNYTDVKSAYIEAANAGLISIQQLFLKAEVIRRQFGDKLSDFLKAIAAAFKEEADRVSIADAAYKMYGLDILEHGIGQDIQPEAGQPLEEWLDPATFKLLGHLEDEADEREREAA